jgi:segregation and condensation protein B
MMAEEKEAETLAEDSLSEEAAAQPREAFEAESRGDGEAPEAAPAAESALAEATPQDQPSAPEAGEVEVSATRAELKPAVETLLFVADEPLPFNQLCKILGEVEAADVRAALDELAGEYEARAGGLEIREIAGGWRISTRAEFHEFVRKYLKSKPTARLSLPALETLAVIAYKQPITIPEILEIRGVSSTSAIKTLLEKRLIITKGRKETVGRPMMYGTSKDFLLHFGLRDLSELPSIEDFEDLAG